MDKEDKAILLAYLIMAIKNTISLICFTILAIAFKKWWIVLFAGLFLSSFEGNTDSEKEDK